MNNVNVRIKYRTGKYTPIDENGDEYVVLSSGRIVEFEL